MMASNSSLFNFVQELFVLLTKTEEMKKLRSGFLIREMLERFKQKAESKLKPDRSLWLYSGHDLTIISLLNSLQMYSV